MGHELVRQNSICGVISMSGRRTGLEPLPTRSIQSHLCTSRAQGSVSGLCPANSRSSVPCRSSLTQTGCPALGLATNAIGDYDRASLNGPLGEVFPRLALRAAELSTSVTPDRTERRRGRSRNISHPTGSRIQQRNRPAERYGTPSADPEGFRNG